MTRYIADFRLGMSGLSYAEIDAVSDREAFDQAIQTNSYKDDRKMLRIMRADDCKEVIVWCNYQGSHSHQLDRATDELWEHGVEAAEARYSTKPEAASSTPTFR